MTLPDGVSGPGSLWPPPEGPRHRRSSVQERQRPEPELSTALDPETPPPSLRTKAARRGAVLLAVAVGVPVAVIGLVLFSTLNGAGSPVTQPAGRPGYTQAPGVSAPVPTAPAPEASGAESAGPESAGPASAGPTVRDAAASSGSASGTGSATAGSGAAAGPPPMIVDNFDGSPSWRRLGGWGSWGSGAWGGYNDLGDTTGYDDFVSAAIANGALTLTYDDDGWFGSYIGIDLSSYTYLVLRVRGSAGGEQSHVRVSLGGVRRMLSDLTLADGTRPVITTAYRDIRIPLAANGFPRAQPGELELDFWHGGAGTISIDEIRFE